MKISSGLFLGVLFILIGLTIIVRVFFDINVIGVLIAIVVIFIGIAILVGRPYSFKLNKNENDVVFEEKVSIIQPKDKAEYNVIFGQAIYDFRDITFPDNEPIRIKVNTIFGNLKIKINKNTPIKIKSDAIFAGASMPDGNSVAFGTIQYSTETFNVTLNQFIIDAPVIFGSIQVREY